jgi:hypothetical protein
MSSVLVCFLLASFFSLFKLYGRFCPFLLLVLWILCLVFVSASYDFILANGMEIMWDIMY